MPRADRRTALALGAALLLAGCERPSPDASGALPVDTAAPVVAAPDAAPAAPDTAFSAVVRRRGPDAFRLEGRAPVPALELTVEDGHDVLFGPVPLEVAADGAFATEFETAPTDLAQVVVFLSDPSGARQWTVAVPRGAEEARWAPVADSAAAR